MGRKPISEEMVKVQFKVRIKKWIADEFKSIDGYNPLVESILENYIINNRKHNKTKKEDED